MSDNASIAFSVLKKALGPGDVTLYDILFGSQPAKTLVLTSLVMLSVMINIITRKPSLGRMRVSEVRFVFSEQRVDFVEPNNFPSWACQMPGMPRGDGSRVLLPGSGDAVVRLFECTPSNVAPDDIARTMGVLLYKTLTGTDFPIHAPFDHPDAHSMDYRLEKFNGLGLPTGAKNAVKQLLHPHACGLKDLRRAYSCLVNDDTVTKWLTER